MDSLSPQENVASVLAHKDPDKGPIDLGVGRQTSIYRGPYLKALAVLGLGLPEIITSPRGVIDQFVERFLKSLDIDFRGDIARDRIPHKCSCIADAIMFITTSARSIKWHVLFP